MTLWCVVTKTQYVAGPSGSVAWTRDAEEAKRIAVAVGGEVVTPEEVVKRFGEEFLEAALRTIEEAKRRKR